RMSEAVKAPLTIYSYGPRREIKDAKILTAYEEQTQNVPSASAIGDLVKDALEMDITPSALNSWSWPKGSPRILFLPGSRIAIRAAALKWLCEVHECLKAKIPDVRVRTLFSQFMPASELAQWKKTGLNPVRFGAGVAMREADFALTQPGTNNFEMMHCGLPGLVVAPEKFLKFVPVAGVLGILANIPLIGLKLRKIGAMRIINRWGGFISLPNRTAQKKILSELYGDVTPEDIAEEICEWVNDTKALDETRKELLSMSGESGAASRLCDIVTSR
ncbi:MAG: hypothetical protein IJU48_02950, partial [Synergistaceae bacterium]|nr:hypothetical protein [Synergistaceae bacterium]